MTGKRAATRSSLRGLAVVLFALPLALPGCGPGCNGDITVSFGEYDSKEAGLRASIPELAAQIRRCPEAEIYRIIWVAPETDPNHYGVDRRSVFYDRRHETIGYEADVFSGSVGRTYVVDDAAIQAVAKKRGTLEDFAEYEKHSK